MRSDDAVDEVEGSDARALDDPRRGTGVHRRRRRERLRGPLAGGGRRRGSAAGSALIHRLEDAADPDAVGRPRALPHRRVRALARLRHDLGRRVGAVRARRGGRRPDARLGRHAAHGRARRSCPRPRVGDVRAALRRRHARALERGQPRAAATDELLPKATRFAAAARERPDDRSRAPRSRSCAPFCDGGVARPIAARPRSRRPCSRPRTSRNAVESFLAEGPGKATFEGR